MKMLKSGKTLKNSENGENGLVGVADRPNQYKHHICPNPHPYPSRSK
jgi:hypothetical protein